MKIAVLGAGAWGTAMALNLADRHDVSLWARNDAQRAAMRSTRVNERYLPAAPFPTQLDIPDDFEATFASAELALIAVTTAGLRDALEKIKSVDASLPVIWLCKGF